LRIRLPDIYTGTVIIMQVFG